MNAEDATRSGAPGPMLVERSARFWWVLLVAGVAWLILGWVVLRANVGSLAAVGVLVGIVLVGSGLNELGVAGMMRGGWKVLHYGLAVLYLLAGLWAFIRPVDTFFALASVLGLVLVFAGAFEITRSLAARGETPYWWAGLVGGVLLLLLALWVSTSDPQATIARRTYLILFWVGFMSLLRGFQQIMLAFGLRHLGSELSRPARISADDDATPAGLPAQERREMSPDSAQRSAPTA